MTIFGIVLVTVSLILAIISFVCYFKHKDAESKTKFKKLGIDFSLAFIYSLIGFVSLILFNL